MTGPLRFFRNLPLTAKILSQMLLLAVLASAITLYLLTSLRLQDEAYRHLLNRDAQVAVLTTEALGILNDASRQVFAVLAEQDVPVMRLAYGVLDGQQLDFHGRIQRVRALIPEKAQELDAIHEQEVEFFNLAVSIVGAASRWRGDKALQIIHGQFEPLLKALRQKMNIMRDERVRRFQEASVQLSAEARVTRRNAALASGVVLLLLGGLSFWTAMTQIARPITRLTQSMRRLSRREYSGQIQYVDWQDEIGQMAQALEFFRSNLQRADYLEIAKAEAEHLAQAKSAFLATMSHEIRTPLNAMLGLIRLSLRRPLSKDQRERLGHSLQAGEHLLSVINNILDFSKLEGGHLQPEKRPFSAEQLLEEVEVMLSGKAAEKGLQLETALDEMPSVLLGDPLRIRQILLNFANNAIKFSDKGRIRLKLRLEGDAQGLFLHGEVIDEGIGLDSEQIKGLFQPFQQADASISRRYGGTGLGLAISRNLAELLGGTLGVESEPGRGSRFWFRVAVEPAAPDQEVAAGGFAESLGQAAQMLRGLRVLVVDDNELNRLVASELLADLGLETDQAGGGEEAIRMLEAKKDGHYDLVLMDMMMPDLDGCATTRRLRDNPRFAHLPIIAMTANTSSEDLELCLKAGMNALVPKPVDEALLVRTLLKYGRSAQRQSMAQVLKVPEVPEASPSPLPLSAQSPEGFELEAAIRRLANNPGLYVRLAKGFLREQQDTLPRVRQWLLDKDTKDTKAAVLALHSLKGLAASLGALRLQEAAARVEALVTDAKTEADADKIRACLDALDLRLQRDRGQLEGLIARFESADEAQIPGAERLLEVDELPEQAPRLLLVDDQDGNIRILKDIFQKDHRVFTANSGMGALEFCAQEPLPDIILLDILMPGMDGLEVCRRLKADPRTAEIPILFVTAQSSPEDESAALAAGGVDFITKPISQAVVRARVQTHLLLKAQQDRFRALALFDGLTGVSNRRHFDERLALAWRDAQRNGRSLALLMVDIDHFKGYNDHYGHQAGDECLRSVAKAIAQHFGRAHDLVARYGGEEFVCLLPETSPKNALSKAMGLCRSVEALGLAHAVSAVSAHVTISIGVAGQVPEDAESPEQLLAAADAALYQAKKSGRNRAELAKGPGNPGQDI